MHHRYDRSAFTLIELLVTVAVLALLGALTLPAVIRAFHHAKTTLARIEFEHFAKTVRWLGEPDPKITDPNTGLEMHYTQHPRFTNYLFTIEKW